VSRQLALFFVATQFLTRLPTPTFSGFQSSWLSQSARYFPLVGVLVGLINVGAWWLSSRWWPVSVSVGLMLAASLLVTGAFHEDGFADACDGFGGGVTADRVLEIMKDSRIGAYGAIGILVMIGLKWTTLVAIPSTIFPLAVIGAHMFSRWCSIGLIWRLPYVRADGDAKAKPFADALSAREWLLSGAIGVLGLLPIAYASMHWTGVGARGLLAAIAYAMVAAVVAAAVTALLAAAYFRRRIGGYTGDCLGAVQQMTELAFLLGALAMLNH
jgi:adenosylcobinamide-GDP ribazoletransferase